MTTKEAITLFKYYLQSNHKRRTIESYTLLLDRFNAIHAERHLDDISPDENFHFLESVTQKLSKSTRRLRYAQLKAFYNFIIERCSLNMRNPCNTPLLSKSFRAPKQFPHKILERETVDEMIYNTKRQRDRLILELQARCGLRIGELLKIKVSDVSDRTITLREPNQAKRLKGPTCQRMYRGNYRNTSKGEIFKEKSGYFPSVIRLRGLLSKDWEPN